MNNVSIYEKNWLDLVFEGKNQEYGAYQLRQQSPRTTLLALFYGSMLLSGVIGIFVLSSFMSKPDVVIDKPDKDIIIRVDNYVNPEIHRQKQTETLPQQQPQKEPTNLSNMIVAETDVANQDIPRNDEVENQTPATEGTVGGTGTLPTENTGGTGITETPESNEPVLPGLLDKLPEFPDGMERFYSYISRNFKTPELEEGTMVTVYVSFVVEKDGTMTDIKVIRNPGNGLDIEAIRVLKSIKTKWEPGVKDHAKVRTLYYLPIKVKS